MSISLASTCYRDDRLSRAINVIDNSTGHFDMGSWRNCAVGQMFRFDEEYLKKEGLKFWDAEPYYRGAVGFDAVARYFGISLRETVHAFGDLSGSVENIQRKNITDYLRTVQKKYRLLEKQRSANRWSWFTRWFSKPSAPAFFETQEMLAE